MLNTTNNIDIKTPATGIIQRSADNSFFLKFHQGSILADEIFASSPVYKGKSIAIIQVMLINEGYMLVEIINEESINQTF